MRRTSVETLRYLSNALEGRSLPCGARRSTRSLRQSSSSAITSQFPLQPHEEQRRYKSTAQGASPSSSPSTSSSHHHKPPTPTPHLPLDDPNALHSHTHYHFFPQTLPSGPPPNGPFTPDLRSLRREFLQLQALAHPDRHVSSTHKARAQALSARINEAYKTLQSPLLRAQYLLSLRGDDSHSDDAAKLGDQNPLTSGDPAALSEDQELLMQVLELREAIEECESEEEVEAMKRENEERIAKSVEVLEDAFGRDDLETARREAVRLRYWVNVEDTLREWEKGRSVVLQH